jgi:hypothetical protein
MILHFFHCGLIPFKAIAITISLKFTYTFFIHVQFSNERAGFNQFEAQKNVYTRNILLMCKIWKI